MNPSEFGLQAQVTCVRRELSYRRFVYPKLIATGKKPQSDADREIACMDAVLVTLTKLLLEEQKTTNPTLFDRIKS